MFSRLGHQNLKTEHTRASTSVTACAKHCKAMGSILSTTHRLSRQQNQVFSGLPQERALNFLFPVGSETRPHIIAWPGLELAGNPPAPA